MLILGNISKTCRIDHQSAETSSLCDLVSGWLPYLLLTFPNPRKPQLSLAGSLQVYLGKQGEVASLRGRLGCQKALRLPVKINIFPKMEHRACTALKLQAQESLTSQSCIPRGLSIWEMMMLKPNCSETCLFS